MSLSESDFQLSATEIEALLRRKESSWLWPTINKREHAKRKIQTIYSKKARTAEGTIDLLQRT